MDNSKSKDPFSDSRGGSKGCLIMAGIVFGLVALVTVLGFIFGGKDFINDFFKENSSMNIQYLRFTFILLIIAIGYYIYEHYFKKS